VRLLFIILFFASCQTQPKPTPKPIDTRHREDKRNWEYLYARELKNALDNEDDVAFHFFWVYYLEARYENKLKKLENNTSSD
jgi:hypothetical protein